jgi:hypothetical protein
MTMQIQLSRSRLAFAACLLAAAVTPVAAQRDKLPPAPPPQLSALSVENLAKPRPSRRSTSPACGSTTGRANRWQFVPEKFTLTPAAQVHYDAGMKALKEGGIYRDDIGQCWPAGMPLIMTRVWPIAMVQLPTVIYMISHFENSVRIIYLDGRQHTDPDVVVRTFNGESIGRWEGDTLVGRHEIFPGAPSLDGSGRRVRAGERGRALHRAVQDAARWRHGHRVPDDRSSELGG